MTTNNRISSSLPIWGVILMTALAGCTAVRDNMPSFKLPSFSRTAKPTVAVAAFTTRLPGGQKATLGQDIAEQLAEHLIQTQKYIVLEPRQTKSRLTPVARSYKSRSQTALPITQNNIHYLITGRITDYGYVELPGWGERVSELNLFHKGYAVVAGTITIADTRTGHTIAVKRITGKIPCNLKDFHTDNNNSNRTPAFAGNAFYHTLMGKATRKFLSTAVYRINEIIEKPPYQPKIASVINGQVIINGGKDMGIKKYTKYVVRPPSNIVLDPDSTEALGYVSGQRLGLLQVTQVMSHYSIAKILEARNELKPQQTLFPL
ncbi:MAG: hypothetical protein IID32_07845, partial [Planctomycetes bacterium]|nr:hypothetical protein [Planctomycetota bacterium]